MSVLKKAVVERRVGIRGGSLVLAVVTDDPVVKGIVKDLKGRFGDYVPLSRVKLLFGDVSRLAVTDEGVPVVDVAVALGKARMEVLRVG